MTKEQALLYWRSAFMHYGKDHSTTKYYELLYNQLADKPIGTVLYQGNPIEVTEQVTGNPNVQYASDNMHSDKVGFQLGYYPEVNLGIQGDMWDAIDDSGVSMIPFVGDALDAIKVGKDIYDGNYWKAALGAGALLLPNIVEKSFKFVGKKFIKNLKDKLLLNQILKYVGELEELDALMDRNVKSGTFSNERREAIKTFGDNSSYYRIDTGREGPNAFISYGRPWMGDTSVTGSTIYKIPLERFGILNAVDYLGNPRDITVKDAFDKASLEDLSIEKSIKYGPLTKISRLDLENALLLNHEVLDVSGPVPMYTKVIDGLLYTHANEGTLPHKYDGETENSLKLNNVTEISDDYVSRNYPIRKDVPLYMSEDQIKDGIHMWFMKGNSLNVILYQGYLKQIQNAKLLAKKKLLLLNKIAIKGGENGEDLLHIQGNSNNPTAKGIIPQAAPAIEKYGEINSESGSKEASLVYADFDNLFLGFKNVPENTELNDFISDYKWRAAQEFNLPSYLTDHMKNHDKINGTRSWLSSDEYGPETVERERKQYPYIEGYCGYGKYHDDFMSAEDYSNYAIPISSYFRQSNSRVGGFYSPTTDKVNLELGDVRALEEGMITPVAAHEISHWYRGDNEHRSLTEIQYKPGELELLLKAYPTVNTFPFYGKGRMRDTSERQALNTQFRTFLAKQLSNDPKRAIFGLKLNDAINKLSNKLLSKYFLDFSKTSGYFMNPTEYLKYGNPNSNRDYYGGTSADALNEYREYLKNANIKNPENTPYGKFLLKKAQDLLDEYLKDTPHKIRYPLDDTWLYNLKRALIEIASNNSNSSNPSNDFLNNTKYAANGGFLPSLQEKEKDTIHKLKYTGIVPPVRYDDGGTFFSTTGGAGYIPSNNLPSSVLDVLYRIISLGDENGTKLNRNLLDILTAVNESSASTPMKENRYTGSWKWNIDDNNNFSVSPDPNRDLNYLFAFGKNDKGLYQEIPKELIRGNNYESLVKNIGKNVKLYYGNFTPSTEYEMSEHEIPLFNYLAKHKLGAVTGDLEHTSSFAIPEATEEDMQRVKKQGFTVDNTGRFGMHVGYSPEGTPEVQYGDLVDYGKSYGDSYGGKSFIDKAITKLEGAATNKVGNPLILKLFVPVTVKNEEDIKDWGFVNSLEDIANYNNIMKYDKDKDLYNKIGALPEIEITNNQKLEDDYNLIYHKDGGTLKQYSELSMKERHQIIKKAIERGITNLEDIKEQYNSYANGGHLFLGGGDASLSKNNWRASSPNKTAYINSLDAWIKAHPTFKGRNGKVYNTADFRDVFILIVGHESTYNNNNPTGSFTGYYQIKNDEYPNLNLHERAFRHLDKLFNETITDYDLKRARELGISDAALLLKYWNLLNRVNLYLHNGEDNADGNGTLISLYGNDMDAKVDLSKYASTAITEPYALIPEGGRVWDIAKLARNSKIENYANLEKVITKYNTDRDSTFNASKVHPGDTVWLEPKEVPLILVENTEEPFKSLNPIDPDNPNGVPFYEVLYDDLKRILFNWEPPEGKYDLRRGGTLINRYKM